MKITVFQKKKNDAEGRQFIAYTTKDKDGIFYQVRFTLECTNTNLIPKNRPFIAVVDNDKASIGNKNYVKNGETFTQKILYIRAINSVEEYVEEPIDDGIFD